MVLKHTPASSAEILDEVMKVTKVAFLPCTLSAHQHTVGLAASLNTVLHEGTAILDCVSLEEAVCQP